MHQFKCGKFCAVILTTCGQKSYYILFAFSAICINNILNENTDIFWKFRDHQHCLIQLSYMTDKCENGQNDRYGRSKIPARFNTRSFVAVIEKFTF